MTKIVETSYRVNKIQLIRDIAGAHREDYCHDLDVPWWASNTRFRYAKSMVAI